MTDAIATLRDHYSDRLAAARAHKAAGGRVVAFLCDNAPVELIEAAGAFPLRVHGDPGQSLEPAKRWVDSLYPPDVTQRPPFVGAMLSRLLAGVYDLADAVIVPHNRNAVQAIHRELHDAAAEYGLAPPATWYLDKAWGGDDAARAFNRDAVARLGNRLKELTGTPIGYDALSDAIRAGNERRAVIAALNARRAERPTRICGALALEMIGASWALPAARFAALASEALAAFADAPPRTGPRLYLGGSPQDHPALYALVERLGATIVAEDHCWGARAADWPVDEAAGPIEALAARFHAFPACSISFPIAKTRAAVAARARQADADGALFYVTAGDATQAWETPGEIDAVAALGLPTLHLSRQPYAADGAALEEALAAFIGRLRA